MKTFRLKIQLGEFPAGSVAVRGDSEWSIGAETFDARGSIRKGEFYMLLEWLVNNECTSIIESIE